MKKINTFLRQILNQLQFLQLDYNFFFSKDGEISNSGIFQVYDLVMWEWRFELKLTKKLEINFSKSSYF